MNAPLFRLTLLSNATRLVFICGGVALMGAIMPVIFVAFGQELAVFVERVPILEQFSNFGGANFFTLTGAIATGFIHPLTLLLVGIMAVAFPALAIAGERATGTLEVTLARPISRRGLFATLYVAGLLFVGIALAVLVTAASLSTYAVGLGHELDLGRVVQFWFGGWLLFTLFMSLTFAVSAVADRAGPAVGIPAVFILLNYLAFAIGSIWPDAQWLEEYSIFNLLKAQDILDVGIAPSDVAIMLGLIAAFVGFVLLAFPRRDIPAPS